MWPAGRTDLVDGEGRGGLGAPLVQLSGFSRMPVME